MLSLEKFHEYILILLLPFEVNSKQLHVGYRVTSKAKVYRKVSDLTFQLVVF